MSFVNDVLARGKSVIVDAKTLLDLGLPLVVGGVWSCVYVCDVANSIF